MNTNALKKFATAARRKLVEQVRFKLDYVLNTDSAALRERADALRQLRDELTRTTRLELIERVAYTWFNRFVALRFLDVNDYQPLGIRAVSPVEGFTTPQLLDEAKQGTIADELTVDARRVLDLLDGRLPSRDPQNEAYALLLTATCNALNGPLPFLFEPLAHYTELLMPDDLLSPNSVLTDIRDGMTTDDCQNVEIIGWLYQFYISERKDAVFAAKSKVKAEDIPAATQLFTPRWVVEYMVQNTLGKLWLRNKPGGPAAGAGLKALMPYYLESPSETSEAYLHIARPEELTLLDPAAGSGHILVYAFELLAHIYEEEGYTRTEIPALILQHNLMGFDIDERAAQLASFALTMKARQYDRRFFRRGVLPRVVALHKLQHTSSADWQPVLTDAAVSLTDTLRADLTLMTQADNLGALIQPQTDETTLQRATDALQRYADQSSDLFRKPLAEDLAKAVAHLALLARKHTCVVMNPPYMVDSNMNAHLHAFVNFIYPNSKTDLMACFMERGIELVSQGGYLSMINQHSWFFLSSYEELRKKIVDNVFIETLLHLGTRTFPEIPGEKVQNTAFTILNKESNAKGIYVRLVDYKDTKMKAERSTDLSLQFEFKLSDFEGINGLPFAFWAGIQVKKALKAHPPLKSIYKSRQGLATGDNKSFIREWYEVNNLKIGFGFKSKIEAHNSKKDWFPIDNGGGFRKWFGNNTSVMNFNEKSYAILKTQGNRCPSEELYFKEGLTWGKISSGTFSVRYSPEGSIFTDSGMKVITQGAKAFSLLSFLNSNSVNSFLKCFSETLNFEKGNIDRLPIHSNLPDGMLAEENISISREDWNARETSWDFKASELLRHNQNGLLNDAVANYETYWQTKFQQLHRNEEELNRIFIDLYGLQDELTPDVDPADITILQQEARPSLSSEEGELAQLQFDRREIMAQFVSYAVGCMFGRYSLEKPGLILASQGQTLADYQREIEADGAAADENTFQPDADNIIPILDEDWFVDDIVARFRAFLRAAFGNSAFNQNMAFVEECLGMDLRKYFVRYFYDDHIRRYRRRPIYWLFRSPKGSFSALIYLHRYTPDTVSRLLNGYLREYQDKLRNRREQQQTQMQRAQATAGEKTRAQKEIDRLDKVQAELAQYERDVIYPLATDSLALDLDDGVLVNYNRFGPALATVKGLTGKVGAGEEE